VQKKIILVCLLNIYFTIFCSAQVIENKRFQPKYFTGSFSCYFNNGKLKSVGQYVKGKREGLFTEYFGNGIISAERTYSFGVLNGPFKEWYFEGFLMREGSFKNNKLDGKITAFDQKGNILETRIYQEGKVIVEAKDGEEEPVRALGGGRRRKAGEKPVVEKVYKQVLDLNEELKSAIMVNDFGKFEELIKDADDDKLGLSLLLSSAFGNDDVVNYLLENKANVNYEGNCITYIFGFDVITPIIAAITCENVSTVQILLNHNPNLNQMVLNHKRLDPFVIAVSISNKRIINLILDKNPELIQSSSKNPEFLFDLISSEGNEVSVDLVKKIIEAGANIQFKSTENENLIHSIASGGNVNVLNYILENFELNVNDKTSDGYTPLMYAKTVEIAEALIKKGAKINESNSSRHNALSLSVLRHRHALAEYLLRNGADYKIKPKSDGIFIYNEGENVKDMIYSNINLYEQNLKSESKSIEMSNDEIQKELVILRQLLALINLQENKSKHLKQE